jgi:hypothetical protein
MLTPWDPLGYKVAHFRQSRRLALQNSQAAGVLWQFRWGNSSGAKCYVSRVILKAVQTGNMTAQELRFNMTVARSYSVSDTTNVASILRAGDNQKLNKAFVASLLTDFKESNAASAASGGTYTQDTDSMALGSYSTVATPTIDGGVDEMFEFTPSLDGDQTLRLQANEGFMINLEAALSGTAAFVCYLEVCWVEATKVP